MGCLCPDHDVYVCACLYVPFKVYVHLKDFHETCHELCASGGHLSATHRTGNNNRVDTRNCEAITTLATRTSVAERMYCIVRDLGKICSVFYDVEYFCHKMEITTWKQRDNFLMYNFIVISKYWK